MAYKSLRDFIDQLEAKGELVRVSEPVSTVLEMTEIQRRLLPQAFVCEGGSFSLAGWLEPSSSAGGDTFDYIASADRLTVGLVDAVVENVDWANGRAPGVVLRRVEPEQRRRGFVEGVIPWHGCQPAGKTLRLR